MKYIVSKDRNTGAEVITIHVDGKLHIVNSSHFNYAAVVDAVKRLDETAARAALNPRQTIENGSNGRIKVNADGVTFDGQPLHNALAKRIVELFRNDFNVQPLVNFMENLDANPSKRAVDELYGFLEACNLPITDDGHFIAYKMVNEDYTSIYDSTFRNDIGTVVEMTRNKVDDNKDRTCSHGLHFASRYYVESGGYGSRHAGHRLVAVKINPADVVSIPTDYNNSKGRACKYLILEELDWETPLQSYFGSPSPIYNNSYFGDDEDHDVEDDFEADESDDDLDPILYNDAGDFRGGDLLPGSSVLTYADLAGIIAVLEQGNASLAAIAKEYGISSRQVARIRDGEAYGAITGR